MSDEVPEFVRLGSGGFAWREHDLTPAERLERRAADVSDAELLALIDAEIDALEHGFLMSRAEWKARRDALLVLVQERRQSLAGRNEEIEAELAELEGGEQDA